MSKLVSKVKNLPITVKVSAAYTMCSILQRCIDLITLPLFTRMLTTEQYGQLTIYNSWDSILTIFLTLNLAYGSFSKAMIKFEDDRDGYISSIEGITLLLACAFLAIYLPTCNIWNKLFELPTEFICLLVAEILCKNAIVMWSGKKRFEFKYFKVIGVTLFISIISPVIALIMIKCSDEKGYARILGFAIVSLAIGGFFFVRNAYIGKRLFDKKYWLYALGFNVPLLAYYLSQVVFNISDRIMISHINGMDKAAIYGVAYSLATLLIFVLNAINNSYLPWYYEKIKDGKEEDAKPVTTGIAILISVLLTIVIWFAPEIIKIIAGAQYVDAIYIVPPVAVSVLLLFYTQLFTNVEFYYEEKSGLVVASIGAAILNLLLNWIFINIYGYVAAGYTTFVSYIVFVISNYCQMKKVLKKNGKMDNSYDYRALLEIVVSFFVINIIGMLLYTFLLGRIVGMLIIMSGILVFRKKIVSILSLLLECGK